MKLLIIICRLIILCLALELCARIDDLVRYGADFWKPYTREMTIEQIDKFGVTGKPNSRYQKWRINNLGFRGQDVSLKKNEGVIRVLCAGASETLGLYEDEGKEWPAQLERQLKNVDTNIEVLNTSFYGLGYTFRNITRRYESFWKAYDPDFFIIYANPSSYIYDSKDSDDSKGKTVDKKTIKEKKSIAADFRIIDKIKNAYRKYIPQRFLNMKDKRKAAREIKINLKKDKRRILPLSEAESRMQEDILRLRDLCKKNRTVLILSSHIMRLDPQEMFKSRVGSPQLTEAEIIRNYYVLNSCLKKMARKENIVFVDNMTLCKATTSNFADGVHFTNKGAATIAGNFYSVIVGVLKSEKAV